MRHYTILTVIVLLVGGPLALCAEEENVEPIQPVTAEVVRLLAEGDSMLAIGHVQAQGSPEAVMAAYSAIADDLYWRQKDVAAFVLITRAGVQYGLTEAARTEGEVSDKLKGLAKALAYNLGSFTWPGWDEPGITLTGRDAEAGLDAAKVNLRLAGELGRGALPRSRAHWLLGAHLLTAGKSDEAIQEFQTAARLAKEAENPAEEQLSLGYAALTKILDGGGQGQEELAAVKASLKGLKDGPFFIEQLDTAQTAIKKWRAGGRN